MKDQADPDQAATGMHQIKRAIEKCSGKGAKKNISEDLRWRRLSDISSVRDLHPPPIIVVHPAVDRATIKANDTLRLLQIIHSDFARAQIDV